MNLARAQKALLAIERHGQRHLRVRRAANDADVREMVQEGLLCASLSDDSSRSPIVLGSITDAGRRFLQIFPSRFRLCEQR
jgi:hypothetical protein